MQSAGGKDGERQNPILLPALISLANSGEATGSPLSKQNDRKSLNTHANTPTDEFKKNRMEIPTSIRQGKI